MIHPAGISGFYKKRKRLFHLSLLVFFLGLPWIKIRGEQAFLLDIANRNFRFMGVFFGAQDAPYLFFVFAGCAVLLGFVTAVFGRFWCGWACPQTVFIETVFRQVEVWIEGDWLARKKLDAARWDLEKLGKRSLKWLLFLLLSGVIAHSLLGVFLGADRLLAVVLSSPLENPLSFSFAVLCTGVLFFNFGWFRENFCIFVCPYGRLQSVLLNPSSLVVAYDANRGEPRGKKSTDPNGTGKSGDCVDCKRCVHVCPTGIDIRNGLQMECIACTACMDACDEVMLRLKRPLGLIRYDSLDSIESRGAVLQGGALLGVQDALVKAGVREPKPQSSRALRSRQAQYLGGLRSARLSSQALIFLFTFLIIVVALSWNLIGRKPVLLTVLRAGGTPYEQVSEQEVVNHFILQLVNQSGKDLQIIPQIASGAHSSGRVAQSALGFSREVPKDIKRERETIARDAMRDSAFQAKRDQAVLVSSEPVFILTRDQTRRADIFIRFPKRLLQLGRTKVNLRFSIEPLQNGLAKEAGVDQGERSEILPAEPTSSPNLTVIEQEVPLLGPF